MKICDGISSYLDGALDGAERQAFEDHLDGCRRCGEEVASWRETRRRLLEVFEHAPATDTPTAPQAARLVERAREERLGVSSRSRLALSPVALAAAILVAGALGAVLGFLASKRGPSDGASAVAREAADADVVYGTNAASEATVRLWRDAIHIGPSSRVEVESSGPVTRLFLKEGALSCDVFEREDDERFTVETAAFEVEVTGTRFMVDLDGAGGGALVLVSEGTVEVGGVGVARRAVGARGVLELGARASVRPAREKELAALDGLFDKGKPPTEEPMPGDAPPTGGELALDGGGPSRPNGPGGRRSDVASSDVVAASKTDVPGIAKWRGWVIEGRLEEAGFALREHLRGNPSDVDAWSLLADCERKLSNWKEALEAYERLIALGDGAIANRARFSAGVVLQDHLVDHERASAMLTRFLEREDHGSSLAAHAKIRLAASLIALGRPARARDLLVEVSDTSDDAATCAKAKRLLDRLEED